MKKWEYMTVSHNSVHWEPGFTGTWDKVGFDKGINELGREGWDLVSVFQDQVIEGTTQALFATFKRPVQEGQSIAEKLLQGSRQDPALVLKTSRKPAQFANRELPVVRDAKYTAHRLKTNNHML